MKKILNKSKKKLSSILNRDFHHFHKRFFLEEREIVFKIKVKSRNLKFYILVEIFCKTVYFFFSDLLDLRELLRHRIENTIFSKLLQCITLIIVK